MHLLHHHHHRCREEKHGHEQQHQTCYNCGRQFMKHHGVLRRRRNHCPACHSKFEDNIVADAIEAKQSSAVGTNNMSRFFKSLTFHPSLKKTKLLLHESTAAMFTTRVPFFNDSTEVREVEEGGGGNDNHMADDTEESPCTGRESCPYALTYETEEVESYQLTHESTNEEVESYQLGWLLLYTEVAER